MPRDAKCFYCFQPITAGIAVNWMGYGGNIFMHPACALDFSVRFMRDIHEAQLLLAVPDDSLGPRHWRHEVRSERR